MRPLAFKYVKPGNLAPGRIRIIPRSVKWAFVLFFMATLAGCGGGNGTSSTAPTASSASLQVAEDVSAEMTLIASDADNDPLTYSIVDNGSKGTATITDTTMGGVNYVPNTNETGTDSFSFKASDGLFDSNVATITISISSVNDAPIAEDGSLSVNGNAPANGVLVAADVDSPILHYTIVSNGGQGTVTIADAATGAYNYMPNPNANGSDNFSFKANDGLSDSNIATITVNISPTNDAPIAQAGTLITIEDEAKNGLLVATDLDSPALTYSIVNNDSQGLVTITDPATGAYTYTPNPNANGLGTFTFKANDGLADSNVATISVVINAVNDPPVAQAGTLTTNEDSAKNGLLVASDVDGPALSYSIVSNGSKGTVTITNAATGAYRYTPDSNASGSDSFTFSAIDGFSTSNTATVTITIASVNDPPVAQDGILIIAEDTAKNGVLVTTDVDSPALTYSVVGNGSKGTVTITDAATGGYLYIPDPDANGSDSFSFKANDGLSDSNIATIAVTITAVNDAPVAEDGALTVDEDIPENDALEATDVENSVLVYSIVSNGSKGTATITNTETGAYSYTPDPNVNGNDSFSFKANDGLSDSNIATVTVTITDLNDPPVAEDGALTTDEDASANGVLVATDLESPLLTYTIVSNGSLGTATITNATTGAYSFTPDPDASGDDSFTFQATDGALDSNIASVAITITPINDPPVATGSCSTTPQVLALNSTLSVTDPDVAEVLTYRLGADGADGAGPIITTKNATITLDMTSGEYTYVPAQGAGSHRGQDSFQFHVTDFEGASSSATEIVIVDQKIMPLGDSITMGEMWIGPTANDFMRDLGLDADIIGYRKSLYDSLNSAGYTFDFVGSLLQGNNLFSDAQHEGRPAWTAAEIAFGQTPQVGDDGVQAWLDANPADIILLHAGTNALLGTSAADVENILIEIENWEIANSNPITVLLALIVDLNPIEPYVTTFNAAVYNMAQNRIANGDDIIIVDQHGALTYPDDLSEDIGVTGIARHPNTTGYTKMADAWFTSLDSPVVLDKCP